jgi:hypothetical protein
MSEPGPDAFVDYFWGTSAVADRWVCFDPRNTEVWSNATKVLYLHGALHLVELPTGQTAKLKAVGASLLEQFAVPSRDDPYPVVPVVITEGSSGDKMSAIRRSEYLSFAFAKWSHEVGPLTVFGHALSHQDRHLTEAIQATHEGRPIAISIHETDPDAVVRRKLTLMKMFPKADLRFFAAGSHPLGRREMNVAPLMRAG